MARTRPLMRAFEKRQVGNTGLAVDTLGFGCASLGNLYHPVSDADARQILDSAWSRGFRYYDTAPHYGQGLSERRVGDALRRFRGGEYVLSTKVGRLLKPVGYADERHAFMSPMPFDIFYDYSYDGIMRSFEDSLQRLGLDRIDILYMHDIGAFTHGARNDELFPIAMDGGYRAMDELRSAGAVSAIGLGVNEYEVCEAALDHGDWDCFLLAGRYTLLEQESLDTFLPRCLKRNCSIVIGGAYNSGVLATGVRGKGTDLLQLRGGSGRGAWRKSPGSKIPARSSAFRWPLQRFSSRWPTPPWPPSSRESASRSGSGRRWTSSAR